MIKINIVQAKTSAEHHQLIRGKPRLFKPGPHRNSDHYLVHGVLRLHAGPPRLHPRTFSLLLVHTQSLHLFHVFR